MGERPTHREFRHRQADFGADGFGFFDGRRNDAQAFAVEQRAFGPISGDGRISLVVAAKQTAKER